jgi:hypothetical protein
MMIDWQAFEEKLFEHGKDAIMSFAFEYPKVVCSFFAYGVDPVYGFVQIGFDAFENGLANGQLSEEEAIENRNDLLNDEDSWCWAHNIISLRKVVDYSPSIGRFSFPECR